MKFSTAVALAIVGVAPAIALPQRNAPPGTPATPPGLRPGESCTTTSTPGVLGCDDGTGGTFNIVNGQRDKRGALEDAAINAAQAATGNFEPGTPVIDGSLNLNPGESCSTTSTKGVLGCDDGTGGTFNIVNGQRVSKRGALEDAAITAAQAATGNFEPGTPVVDGSLDLNSGESCSTTSTKGVLGCDDGTGGTFNIVNGKRVSKRDARAVTAAEAAKGDFEPGTPVVDPSLNLNPGEVCTTTSTKGVLACNDETGATFNIVNGERETFRRRG